MGGLMPEDSPLHTMSINPQDLQISRLATSLHISQCFWEYLFPITRVLYHIINKRGTNAIDALKAWHETT